MANNPDVKLIFDSISKKQSKYNLMYAYYQGLHPLKYSASRLRKTFERLDTYFSQNWVAVIVDAMLDRLALKGFDVSDNDNADTKLDEIWKEYNLELIADDIHESAIVTGEGFIIALSSDEDDTETPYDIYFNDARMCHMIYEYDQPNKKRVAGKIYANEQGKACLTLYYKDRFEYYLSNTILKSSSFVSSSSAFYPDPDLDQEPNPFDEIPVFHFQTGRVSKRKDLGPSEISLQDAINKLLTDMLVSSEFNTFIQRVIISSNDPGNLQNIPGANWWIPAGDGKGQQTSVLELGGRALDPFLNAIDKLATSLAIISRTPKHYFFAQGGDPSGEALLAMEAPLNKKVKKRQEIYSVEWQSLARFILVLSGIKDVRKSQIQPLWEPPETIQPKTSAETTKTEVDSGIPLVTSLRRKGWSNDEIKQLEDDKKEEKKQSTGLAQDALAKLRAQDAQNNNMNSNVSNTMPMQNQGVNNNGQGMSNA